MKKNMEAIVGFRARVENVRLEKTRNMGRLRVQGGKWTKEFRQ